MASPFRIARWVRRGVIGRPAAGRIGRVAARFFLNPMAPPPAHHEVKLTRGERKMFEEIDRRQAEAYEEKKGM